MRRQIEVGPIDGEPRTFYMPGCEPNVWMDVALYLTMGVIIVGYTAIAWLIWRMGQ